jgi:hypothetical protein
VKGCARLLTAAGRWLHAQRVKVRGPATWQQQLQHDGRAVAGSSSLPGSIPLQVRLAPPPPPQGSPRREGRLVLRMGHHSKLPTRHSAQRASAGWLNLNPKT